MAEAFNYIFNSMERTEKLLRKQSSVNRNVAVFAAAVTVYMLFQAKKINELDYEVCKLKREIAASKED